jgi:hypothetical protein
MAMTVHVESPPGNPIFDNMVPQGALVRFQCYVSGTLGLPEPFVAVHAQLTDVNLKVDGVTSLAGNAALDVQMPNRTAQPTVTVWHEYLLLVGDDKQSFTMGVGGPPAPNPTPGGNSWDTLLKFLPWVALIAAVGYAVNAVRKK